MRFQDRREAGRLLAERLRRYASEAPVVIGLPRGGVPVADEIARALDAPLDVWVVRKLGVPGRPELGMGAIAEGGALFLDHAMISELGISTDEVEEVAGRETAELQRRVKALREGRPPPNLAGRTVIVVDDGIATGGTMRACLRAILRQAPSRVILAVPVAATQSLEVLAPKVTDVVCLLPTDSLWAIGLWYEDFGQVSTDEVIEILRASAAAHPNVAPGGHPGSGP